MKVVSTSEFKSEQGTTFTGDVTLDRMLTAQSDGGVVISSVYFRDGARTNWHTHPGEQVLIIVEGQCRAGTETERFTAGPGDVIYAPPGEKHWHGAMPGSSMRHISVTTHGSPTWLESPEED